MNNFEILITLGIAALGLRTAGWWMQSWQIREYRWDRMRAWMRTRDGRKNLANVWFFSGIAPRPRITGRVLLIGMIWLSISSVGIWFGHEWLNDQNRWGWSLFKIFVLWERTIWLTLPIAVKLSAIPVWWQKQAMYREAASIISDAPNVVRIGITGSFGKSSTRRLLVHLLQEKYGADAVLANPGNENTEISIARLIRRNRRFFELGKRKKKFFVCEIGAYRRGEIRRACEFVQPQISILTGLNAQHVDLFGSLKKLRQAKFEIAEAAMEKVFFNADTPELNEIFIDSEITATPIGIRRSAAENVTGELEKTTFEMYGEKFSLPWAGEFFVGNALLALECARECGASPNELSSALSELPPLEQALHIRQMSSGAAVLLDPYSANPDGVIGAIGHLERVKGHRVFVGIPLRELGRDAANAHRKIFTALHTIDADVFWMKSDFSELGKKICGKKFHGSNKKLLKKIAEKMDHDDGVLLESRLPEIVSRMFE